ncbi:MAG: Hsp20/alpha crystallin family protein [Marinilabilia sp.]
MALERYTGNATPRIPSFLNDLFGGDLMDWGMSNFAGSNMTLPAVNVREDDNEYAIEVAAPGLKKDDFKVDYQNGKLTISSEKQDEKKEEEEGNVTRREFNYQSFQRTFNVPENMVKDEDISARYEDGILKVSLPKSDEAKPKPAKTIKIE